MNAPFGEGDPRVNNVKTAQQIEQLIAGIKFSGLTPMGTQLKQKVTDHIVQEARQGRLKKPVLVIIVTDGQPAGEPPNAVFDTIREASSAMSSTQYGKGALAFQFAQVGNDVKAREFLAKLDNDPQVGALVDCTSSTFRTVPDSLNAG